MIYNRHSRVGKQLVFAKEYRSKFLEFVNQYIQTYDKQNSSGYIDNEIYVWLATNCDKIQNSVGHFGVIAYLQAFQNYIIEDYPIITNTILKFCNGKVESFDSSAVDNCLLRYIGYLEEYRKVTLKSLKNPFVWFHECFIEILSIPFLIVSWLGIISNENVNSIKDSSIYRGISGLFALVILISEVATIVVGYDPTIEFVKRLIGK